MTSFSHLAGSPALPAPLDGSRGAAQQELDALPSAIASSPLRLWVPGNPIPTEGNRLLIGVATWSNQDMALLDLVSQALAARNLNLTVDVFNVVECDSTQAFERYVPGIRAVFHTPVAGLWCNGKLVEKASGKAGRDLVARMCALDIR